MGQNRVVPPYGGRHAMSAPDESHTLRVVFTGRQLAAQRKSARTLDGGPEPFGIDPASSIHFNLIMVDPVPEVRDAIVELSLALLTEDELQADLERILRAAQLTVPGCEAGSVTLLVEGSPQTEAAISRVVVAIDLAQCETQRGPCVLATALNTPILINVLSTDERFPNFLERAASFALHSTLSLPVTIGREVVGSLNLYAGAADAFDPTSQDIGGILATQVGIAVAKSRLLTDIQAVASAAQQVADESSDIAVAEGMVMVIERCSLGQAQSLLRNAATSEAKTLVVIARRVIAEVRAHVHDPQS